VEQPFLVALREPVQDIVPTIVIQLTKNAITIQTARLEMHCK
jgi:hypothetical protein